MYEVRVVFTGNARKLGLSHEWYAPRTGFFRVERVNGGQTETAVFNGRSVTRRRSSVLMVDAGSAAFLRAITAHPDVFAMPGVAMLRAYLSPRQAPAIEITAGASGAVLRVRMPIAQDSGPPKQLTATVTIVRRETLAAAMRRGVFSPPRGRPVIEFLQEPPGSPARFGEPAYWFGPTLGEARAVTAFAYSGSSATATGAVAAPKAYTTIYRLPRQPTGTAVSASGAFPGIGDQLPIDTRLECRARGVGGFPATVPGIQPTRIELGDGRLASLYLEAYQRGDHTGSRATFVIGRTAVCYLSGLIPPTAVRQAAPTLRPVR